MQIKNLAVFLFSATALATVEKRDQMDDQIEEYLSSAKENLPSQYKDMPLPDPSVAKIMVTAVPQNVLTNPKKLEEVGSSIANDDPPKWVEDMPEGAQDYLSELQEYAEEKTGDGASPTSGGGSGGSGGSDDSDESSAEESGSEESGAETVTSTGGAPAPTGAVAASLAGAVGILGLAVAL